MNHGGVHLGSLQRCRKQGAVYGFRVRGGGNPQPAKVQQAGCGARGKLQRCGKQGAVLAA